ncbi:Efflux pump aflT [Ceratocystis fimbriata CBS 114723]|uniref:Efflux pump aflT n=1 Tax=Ceratocystis fimbriata CBS 114723 TaxID=1035309 RepID=A0A2C5XH79_9PEZI|nr:Efflux pump aflT [Ceratocystis fimbriata CBS 114723]
MTSHNIPPSSLRDSSASLPTSDYVSGPSDSLPQELPISRVIQSQDPKNSSTSVSTHDHSISGRTMSSMPERYSTAPTIAVSFVSQDDASKDVPHIPSHYKDTGSSISLPHHRSKDVGLPASPLGSTDASEPPPATDPVPPADAPGAQAQTFNPKSLRFWLIIVSNFVAIFLVALDRTILTTAIPKMTDAFRTQSDIGWYGSAYMLTSAASQLLFGRIYKFYNIKWTYLFTIIIFEAGSIICAAAPTSITFIIGRAVAGVGSAGIFSGSMMIMIPMVPLPRRPLFQAAFGMVFGISSVVGPLVGGGFTQAISWRWCFWINLPVGGIAFILLLFLLQNHHTDHPPVPLWQHIMRLDPIGTLFFIPSIVSLLLALQWGGSQYEWDSWRIILLFSVFAVAFIAFGVVQIVMPKTATVPRHVICQRSMLAGAFFMLFLSGAMMMAIYYVPLWFQTVKHVSPVNSGVYTIPLMLSMIISSVISGIGIQKFGYYVPSMILCPIIMAIGEGFLSTLNPNTSSSKWIAFQFLAGFGLGFGMQTVNLAVQTVMPKEDVSTGIAISFFSQQLGAAIFVSVGQSILSNLLRKRLRGIPGIGDRVIISEGATHLRDLVPPQFQSRVAEAYNHACTRIFFAGAMLCCGTLISALFMQWKSVKTANPDAPTGQAGQNEKPESREVTGAAV